MAFNTGIGASTISNIVPEVCKVLWKWLAPVYMKVPNTKAEWRLIAANFWEKWQFPMCLGAIDGKHVVMKCPDNTGSLYYNYKGTFSTVLMALVDANLQFIAIDVGSYGRNSDGGIFSNSNLGRSISSNGLNFPDDEFLPNVEHHGRVPYVMVGDEAFPLQRHLMRPYPGRGSTKEEKIYNYRLSRARRIVENGFGLLASRWRVFYTKVAVAPECVKHIVKATCVLHNMLQADSTPAMVQNLSQHTLPNAWYNENVHIQEEEDRDEMRIRDVLKEFFHKDKSVPWQEPYVQRGIFSE